MKHHRMIGQYQIVEQLATGGAGEVYAGIDTKLGREVAIKFLRPELASDPITSIVSSSRREVSDVSIIPISRRSMRCRRR